jgi:hypothetical protein
MQPTDMLDARMRHRRRNGPDQWHAPTETIPAIPAVPAAVTRHRGLSRDWLGILVILPVTFLGIALVVGAGTWGDAQDHARVIHKVRVLTRWREHAITVTAPPQIRTVAGLPQVRTVAVTMRPAAPRPAPAVTVTVTARPVPAPTVTVTVTATPAPAPAP